MGVLGWEPKGEGEEEKEIHLLTFSLIISKAAILPRGFPFLYVFFLTGSCRALLNRFLSLQGEP